MKLVSQEEAKEIAEKCEFRKPCGICTADGEDETMSCCGFCIDYGKRECKGIVCPDLKEKLCPIGVDRANCYGCYFVRSGVCKHDEILMQAGRGQVK